MIDILKSIDLSFLGNVASIIGLILTIGIFINMRSIRRFYIFTARAPELLDKLGKHAGNIVVFLKDYSNSHREIQLELAHAEIVLRSIKGKVGRQTKSSVCQVLKTVKNYNHGTEDQDKLWVVYLAMQKLIIEVQELQSDLKWER